MQRGWQKWSWSSLSKITFFIIFLNAEEMVEVCTVGSVQFLLFLQMLLPTSFHLSAYVYLQNFAVLKWITNKWLGVLSLDSAIITIFEVLQLERVHSAVCPIIKALNRLIDCMLEMIADHIGRDRFVHQTSVYFYTCSRAEHNSAAQLIATMVLQGDQSVHGRYISWYWFTVVFFPTALLWVRCSIRFYL